MAERTPAGRLVSAFGDVARMRAMYAADIAWSLSASLNYPRPMTGIDAVTAFNESVWGQVYHPDCTVAILDEVGDDRASAVRFIYRARIRSSGVDYENEYTLFARSGPAGITEVFEALDTLAVIDQSNGDPVGTFLARTMQGAATTDTVKEVPGS